MLVEDTDDANLDDEAEVTRPPKSGNGFRWGILLLAVDITVWADVEGIRSFLARGWTELSDMGGLIGRSGVRLTIVENSADRRRRDFSS